MKTNQQFDEAWRRLQAARRSELLNEIHDAAENLAHATRMLILDSQQSGACHHPITANGQCLSCRETIKTIITNENT